MTFSKRPERLRGYDYTRAGPVFHCRLALSERARVFADERIARALVDALGRYHDTTLRVLAYCVMPDHVHLLVGLRKDGHSLSRAIGDLKRWVTRQAGAPQATVRWQRGFFERVIRCDEDLLTVARYIMANPVRAGLVAAPSEYPWAGSLEWDLWSDAEQ